LAPRKSALNAWALVLELVLLVGFLSSLGALVTPLLQSSYGSMLMGVTGLLGLVLPLVIRLVHGGQVGDRAVVRPGTDWWF
jgi:hypothetical protein